MCVTDGTTTAPIAWPGAAAPQGVAGPQGPAGVGIPSPVVNGSWIKGVSGAAVWTPIVQGDLPATLQAQALGMPGDDYNQALSAGWYFGSPSSANRPGAYWCHVQVFQFGGPQYKQVAQRYDALDVWERFYIGGSGWFPWYQTQFAPSGWINVASNPGYVNGFADYGVPYGPAQYRKLSSGLVVYRGLISAPGPGLAFTPPAGYRIQTGSTNPIFHTASSVNLGTETWRIDGNGAMVYSNAAGWVSVSGIHYFAES